MPVGIAGLVAIPSIGESQACSVGGVAVGDSFGFEITYESMAIIGPGKETLFFDGLSLSDASVALTVGSEGFDETGNGGSISSLSFKDGRHNYRLVSFVPVPGAENLLFLEDGLFTQQLSTLPLGVLETEITEATSVPELTTALLVGLGETALAARRGAWCLY